jgi:hypothetical protein
MSQLNTIIAAIQNGLLTRSNGSVGGCGRAYVCFSKMPTKQLNTIKKALELCGIRYMNEAYGVGKRAAYIGYDNADGHAWSKAVAIANNLRALGISCYEDGQSD